MKCEYSEFANTRLCAMDFRAQLVRQFIESAGNVVYGARQIGKREDVPLEFKEGLNRIAQEYADWVKEAISHYEPCSTECPYFQSHAEN